MHTLTRLGSVCTCTGACHRFQGHLEGHTRAHGALCPPTRKVWARSAGCHWASRGTDERCPDVVHKSVVQLSSVKVLSSTTRELSHTHPQSRPTLRTAGTLQGVPPSWCGRRAAGVEWGVFEPAIKSKRHDAQAAANLAVEGAEESLSILPDYTPTVRPPPKRC
jgi:hypothetical protein